MHDTFEALGLPTINDSNAAQWVRAAAQVARSYTSPSLEGRGIVIPGGGRYLASAYVLARTLRYFDCCLPIQVWYLGEHELATGAAPLFERAEVDLVNARAHRAAQSHKRLNGWELKAFALLHCPWREVLLLDADNLPLRPVDSLFAEPLYQQHGALFWPDRGRWPVGAKIWQLTEIPYRDEPEFESGQILVDRQRCWNELVLANWFNQESAYWYSHVHGDKDTFRLAWRALEREYGMVSHNSAAPWPLFWQKDPAGQLLFHHGLKWTIDFAKNQKLQHVPDVCYQFMAEYVASTRSRTLQEAACAPTLRWTAQYGEDRWVSENVALPDRGVFVEVGAAGGIEHSNTYWLEQLGWTGLLVEADVRNISGLNQARRTPVAYCAAAAHDGTLKFVQHPNRTWSGARRPASDGQRVLLPARRLDTLCRSRGIAQIDLLSIDTEGTEVDVLEGLGELRPSVIIAEFLTEGLADTRAELQQKLESIGYRIVHTTYCNVIATLSPA